MSNYTPISCSLYDVLEASATRRALIELNLPSSGESKRVLVLDLFSRDRQEFMKAKDVDTGQEFTLRLDEISAIRDVATDRVFVSDRC